jgi:hypothetical protein
VPMVEYSEGSLPDLPKRHPWPVTVNGEPVITAVKMPTEAEPVKDSFVVIVWRDHAVHPFVVWVVTTRNGVAVSEEDVLSSGFHKLDMFSALMCVAEKYAATLT